MNKAGTSKDSVGLSFTKMTGTGNDFIILDSRDKGFPKFDRALLVKSICRRSFSIGADGVVFLEKPKSPKASLKWDFYNADGSKAEFCGNAARCVARYALDRNIADRSTTIETTVGNINTRVRANGIVEVEMPVPKILKKEVQVPVGEKIKIQVLYVDTGVPHVVRENDDWDDAYLAEMGSYLRHSEFFNQSGGANATFYEILGPSKIHAATFERGVEAITMACGTGAVAAAMAAVLKGSVAPLEVLVPGGTLHVNFENDFSRALLAGEARFICSGEILPEALL